MLLQYKYVDLEFPACLEAKNPASPALFTQTRLGMYELMDNRHASLLIVSINYLWAGKGCKKMGGVLLIENLKWNMGICIFSWLLVCQIIQTSFPQTSRLELLPFFYQLIPSLSLIFVAWKF